MSEASSDDVMAPTQAQLNRLSRHRHAGIYSRSAAVWLPTSGWAFSPGLPRTTCTRHRKRDGSRGLAEAPSLIAVVRSSVRQATVSPDEQACRKMMQFSQ